MAIKFQCEHCEQINQVPDELGGRMGQCPHCGHSMYIPLPAGQASEALELDEVNPEDEARQRKLMEQTRRTLHRLWQDKPVPEGTEKAPQPSAGAASRKPKPIDPEDAAMTVQEFVLAMARGSLDEAESFAAHLVGNPQVVNPIIIEAMEKGFSNSSLQNVPAAVQKGFLRKLVQYLNG